MKILFLTQFFYPDIQATSKIFTELCEDLAKDFKLKIICGQPLFKAGESKLTGSLDIVRVFSTCFTRRSILNRIINWLSFSACSLFYIFLQSKDGVFIFTSDNPFNFIPAIFFKRKKRIYLCQDLYWEQIMGTGLIHKNIFYYILGLPLIFLQKLSFIYADKIVVIGEEMRQYLVTCLRVKEEKIRVIHNWASTEEIKPSPQNNLFSREHSLVGKFVVLYSGRIGLTQDMETLLDCAVKLQGRPEIKFVIVGEGAKKKELVDLANNYKLGNIIFLTYQSQELYNDLLATAAISVILLKGGISSYMVPSKLFNIMASARPVIAAVDKVSQTAQIINNAQCGSIITPGSSRELTDNILKIYENQELIKTLGNNGREYVVNNFSRQAMTEKYNLLISEVTGQ